jgi:hypothetical protein
MLSNLKVIRIRFHLLLVILAISPIAVYSQSAEESKNIFAKAESYYIYEEYELANQLYILIDSPDNMNVKYKIGSCYINIPSEKEKSIPYLEAAVKTATYDSKTESYKELRAPLDAYFFLGKAYMINNEFDKGLSTLMVFSKLAGATKAKGGMQNVDFVDQQIQACKNAIQFTKVPIVFSKESLGADINQGSINDNAAVSYDGNSLAYTQRLGIVNAIFFAKRVNGKWQSPVEITRDLKAGEDCSTCSLNADGTELFLYKTDNYDGAIYSSNFVNGKWMPIRKLNKNINTKFYESHAAISADGKKLYFTSNRDGGQGNLDIYVSEKEASGDWGPAVNLGPTVNTPYNEDTPFITQDGDVLYFSSEGHNSMGGYDNFKSQRSGSGWKTPSNLGYPINSADDDKFYQPFNNGQNAYYTLTTAYKKKDIFYLTFAGVDNTQNYKITGKIKLNDTIMVPGKKYDIRVVNKVTGDTLYKTSPEKSTGSYSLNVAPGIFRILFMGSGYYTNAIDTVIVQDNPEKVISLNITLYKDTTIVRVKEPVYEKIDLKKIPSVALVDTSILIRNMKVNDANDTKIIDADVLYYTVQVIALYHPVDVTYFKYIHNIKIMYNDADKFYRYTTGKFMTKDDAYAYRLELLKKGYPDQIFVKKISK